MDNILGNILKSRRNVLLIFLLTGIALYAVVLPTEFKTMDDLVSIVNNPRVHDVKNIGEIFTTSFFTGKAYYRPLVLVSFMLEYQLFGPNAFFYNLNNLLLHVLCAFLAYLIVLQFLNDKKLSFISALIYLIHPVHWEAVSNIPGRSILLCSVFFLGGFYFYQKSLEQEGTPKLFALSLAGYALALLCKESAIVLPACLMSYLFFVKKPDGIKAYLKLWPYAVIAVIYLMLRRALGINAVILWSGPAELILGVVTFFRAGLHFLGQTILPVELYYDHTTVLFKEFNTAVWMVILFWSAVAGVLFTFRKKLSPAIKFFIAWIFINFVTVMQIIPIHAPGGRISTADHFLYIPILGGIVILVCTAARLLKNGVRLAPSIQYFLVGGYVAFLCLTLLQQNIYATNQIAMFKRSLAHHPGNIRVRNSLAVCYAYAGKFQEAEYHYTEALKTDPYNTDALIGAGQSMADQGRYAEALAYYQKVRNQEVFEKMYKRNLDFVTGKLAENPSR